MASFFMSTANNNGMPFTGTANKENDGLLFSSHRKKTPNSKYSVHKQNDLTTPANHNSNTPSTEASTPSSPMDVSPLTDDRGEFYAIRQGRNVQNCIFASWESAKQHIEGCEGAVYNVFDKMEEAMLYIQVVGGRPSVSHDKNNATAVVSKKRVRNDPIPFANLLNQSSTVGMAVAPTKAAAALSSLPAFPTNYNKENGVLEPATKKPKAAPAQKASVPTAVAAAVFFPKDCKKDLPETLEEGYKKNHPKGWRANMIFPGKRQDRELWESSYLNDIELLKTYRASRPSNARDVHSMTHISGIPNAFSLAYLNWSWGVGEAYHRYLAFQQRKNVPKKKSRTKSNRVHVGPRTDASCNTCVITSREAARKRFTARAMFYSFRVQQLMETRATGIAREHLAEHPDPLAPVRQSPLVNGCSTSKKWMDQARADWDVLSDQAKRYWDYQELLHDAKQPQIIRLLEESLAKNPKRSAKKLSQDIGYWCGKTTIGKWKNLRMGPSYRKGIQNPISRDSQYLHLIATTALAGLKHDSSSVVNNSAANAALSNLEAPAEVSEHDDSTHHRYGDGSSEANISSRRSSLSSSSMAVAPMMEIDEEDDDGDQNLLI